MPNKYLETPEKFTRRANEYFSPEFASENSPYNIAGLAYFLECSSVRELKEKKNESEDWLRAISRIELKIEDYMTRKALTREIDGNMTARYNQAYNASYQMDKAPAGPKTIVLMQRGKGRAEIIEARDIKETPKSLTE